MEHAAATVVCHRFSESNDMERFCFHNITKLALNKNFPAEDQGTELIIASCGAD